MEDLQARFDWYHSTDLEQKFHLFPRAGIEDMLTKEEKEAFFLECENKGILQDLFFSVLDWRKVSRWKTRFMVFLYKKNPEFISFFIFRCGEVVG